MKSRLLLGLDIGSVSLNTVVMNADREILEEHYTRLKGQPLQTVISVLTDLFSRIAPERIARVSVTGSGGKLVAELLGGEFVNEVVAQTRAVKEFHPEVRTAIEIGGEDAKLLILNHNPEASGTLLEDFAMNTQCAAGTGSFLDQQASRLGLSIEEFGQLSLKSEHPPRIAGRCSVFAKSDMIHLQQIATPDYDIVAGLCYAMARNFKSNIGKGKSFNRPISFQGGVAANVGMIRAFKAILELDSQELIIPTHYASMGAIGAVLTGLDTEVRSQESGVRSQESGVRGRKSELSLDRLTNYAGSHSGRQKTLAPLSNRNQESEVRSQKSEVRSQRLEIRNPKSAIRNRNNPQSAIRNPQSEQSAIRNPGYPRSGCAIEGYLGIDIGSLSTNLVVIDQEEKVIAWRYLMTAGRPIEAVRKGLDEIGQEVGGRVNILGVGTTGSGRYMIGDLVGADVVRNEITAQATAAVNIDPTVDTIFEIGGQDSKYIRLAQGAVVDFEMNKVCAAGTGSFLEEQSEKLNINIVKEFGETALRASSPDLLGDRCTVFIESDLVAHQQQGSSKDNLAAGLAYSIVYNYLNRVVGTKSVGEHIFFQGGVASNQAVVAAFEKVTGKKITVPPYHNVTGAMGAAILAKEESNGQASNFKGFDLSKRQYKVNSFACKSCDNVCDVMKVEIEGEKPLFYGTRCEKYEQDRKKKKENNLPDLFKEREEYLLDGYKAGEKGASETDVPNRNQVSKEGALKIGIPRVLNFYELFPYWNAFFSQLGLEVVLSGPTKQNQIHQSVEVVTAETCFPIKVVHGHILSLIEAGVDYIFLPSVLNMAKTNPALEQNYACPYVQAAPYIVKSAIDVDAKGIEMLTPNISFQNGNRYLSKELVKLGRQINKSPKEIKAAMAVAEAAQGKFYRRLTNRGREILASLDPNQPAAVLISRPYNGCDPGLNLEIPKKLRDMGVLAIPMDFLPLEEVDVSDDFPNMYWKYGQKIISAAGFISSHPFLNAIYLTNFGCGPDSFILHFCREKMNGRPYLQLEVDEHSADAGAITRCEAFFDSLKGKRKPAGDKKRKAATGVSTASPKNRTLYLSLMSDHAYSLAAAFRACGVPAETLPESDDLTLEYGKKYTSGKECFPCVVTTGDILKKLKEKGFVPANSAFFMPSADGPCRFGQYSRLHRIILDDLGYEDIPILSPDSKDSYSLLGENGNKFRRRAWQGIAATDILEKISRQTRPYEVNSGETNKVYQGYLTQMAAAIESGNGKIFEVMEEASEAFSQIKTDRKAGRPIIGVIGEIYTRANRFSNADVIRKIEGLGGEVWFDPISEWFYYVNYGVKESAFRERRYLDFLKIYLKDKIQKYDEDRLTKHFKQFGPHFEEPGIAEVIGHTAPYLSPSIKGGEMVPSIGKAIDFIHRGASGIVNCIPFTCMPGNVVTAISRRIREDFGNIPWLNIAYDGQEESRADNRLEAFMYQAKQFRV
ncbi:MAG: acyl-CoA dehydratase activase [bacterium]|nr:acyl-CoA dehydratase activase [bacterium]